MKLINISNSMIYHNSIKKLIVYTYISRKVGCSYSSFYSLLLEGIMVTWFLLIYYVTGQTEQHKYKSAQECKSNLEKIYFLQEKKIGWIHCQKDLTNEWNNK